MTKGQLARLLKELGVVDTKDAVGTETTCWLHGPGGLLATTGVEADLFSTIVRPSGLQQVLIALPEVYMHPLFGFVTGVSEAGGDEPSTRCGDCREPGLLKVCDQAAPFGRVCVESHELEVGRLGQRNDRSELFDFRLMNNPLLNDVFTPEQAVGVNGLLSNEIKKQFFLMGTEFQRKLGPMLYTGNPANNVGTGYMEFYGLESLVGTGKVDAITGTACPSLDSDIKDFAYSDVCSGDKDIVQYMTYMYRTRKALAEDTGLAPVNLVWVMREPLFYELTACWPCSYSTYRCLGASEATPLTLSSETMLRMRDEMRSGKFLYIDGEQVPVITDSAIPEYSSATNGHLHDGQFSSDIYLLPLTVLNGIRVLYLQHFDYRANLGQLQVPDLNQRYWWTDGGKFLWTYTNVNFCFKLKTTIEPRLILRTPQLAGRLQNVVYEPLQHTREPFPANGYWVDGGKTYTSTRSIYY